jgi:hypothetical protein
MDPMERLASPQSPPKRVLRALFEAVMPRNVIFMAFLGSKDQKPA